MSPSSSNTQVVVDKEMELDKLDNASGTPSNEQPAEANILPPMSNVRRAFLLAIFCFALFVDAFMTSGMIICLDDVQFHESDWKNNVLMACCRFVLTSTSPLQ